MLHPIVVQSCCRLVITVCPTLARPCEGVHGSTLLMSSSLLLQQCPVCLVHLIWTVFEMGGRCSYSCCFGGCCFQDLFNTANNTLVQLLSSFSSIHLVSILVVHPYSSTDMTAAWIPWGKMEHIILVLTKETVAAIMMLDKNTKVKIRS